MLTRCPHCQTHFRVTAEHLKIRQGQVRCGVCQDAFDALDSLSDETPVPPETVTVAPPAAIVTVESIPAAANEFRETNAAPEPIPTEPEPPPTEPEPPPTELEPPPTEPVPAPPEPEPPPPPVPEPEKPAVAELETVPAAPAPPRRWPWLAGVCALLLVAAGQLTYIYRTELATLSPALRPALVTGCAWLGCTLPRPFNPALVGIETSDLAPEGSGLLLTATLSNRAPFVQDFPHLELTLTDTQDAALVRKVLAPADWLPASQDAAQGFPARGEIAIRLNLATDDVPAVGYRLYLFYP